MKPRATLTMDEGGQTYNLRIECENDDEFWVNVHIESLPQYPEGEDPDEDDDAEETLREDDSL